MKLAPKIGLWITTIIWVGVIAGLWGNNHYQLTHGKKIQLKTIPVDPRDLFRGDYVTLRYEISSLNLDSLGQSEQYFTNNSTVFVSLTEKDGFWHAIQVHDEMPEDGIFIRGRVIQGSQNTIAIKYGIESYFVPEGKGRDIEDQYSQGNLAVSVAVSPYGKGYISGLKVSVEK